MKNTALYLFVSIFVSAQLLSCASSTKKDVSVPIVKLEKIRDLTLAKPLDADSKNYISAASGLVKKGKEFFLISDNERFLFSLNLTTPYLKSYPLLKPPEAKTDKKVDKPDFEALAWLTPQEWPPYGAIVAWPSASNPQRVKAVVTPFYLDGTFGKPLISDITQLVTRLETDVKNINMEGLLVYNNKVHFLQRGNGPKGKNGIVEMSLANWSRGMKNGDWSGEFKFTTIELGSLNGVPLTFSDADWTKHGLMALATAESSSSVVSNGAIQGTVLVKITEGKSQVLAQFDQPLKLEGIVVEESAKGLQLFLVDDSDGDQPSQLFKATLPLSHLGVTEML